MTTQKFLKNSFYFEIIPRCALSIGNDAYLEVKKRKIVLILK